MDPSILPYILEPSTNQQHSILDYNEKLQKTTDLSQNKCRIYSTFHRLPTTPVPKDMIKNKVVLSSVYEDVTSVFIGEGASIEEKYFNVSLGDFLMERSIAKSQPHGSIKHVKLLSLVKVFSLYKTRI